ncbi:MAG: mechanosensitive ion channel family protein [Planctomycetes bacterium]|nr:mechanosensitive ion channel family protein [Planctomycetota bacterium]
MDFSKFFNDDRLLTNLISIHVVLAVVLLVSIILRKLLKDGGEQVVRWTGLQWLDGISKEAVKGMRSMLFWSTVVLMVASVASMAVYHVSGRNARADFQDWFGQLTGAHLLSLGLALGKLVALAIGVALGFRLLRRLRVFLEAYVHHHLPKHVQMETPVALPFAPPAQTPAAEAPGSPGLGDSPRRAHLEETIRRWFTLLERFCLLLMIVGALWLGGRVVGFTDADGWAGLVLKIVTYFMIARLLTLACRTLFHVFASMGNKHLDRGQFHRYWERIVRLFPLGERCFEAAIWIFAASQCAEALSFIAFVAKFGTGIVQCIGIFYGTRVLIEFLHVFINQAFGMYKDEQAEDQKGQTLVPLLESISQYVLYFGCALMMLRVFEVDTTPILAGAGVVGLAVGLGAQNLVADVVAGFFILFENQFLVGDIIQVGDAVGRVEAINIRCTQIRDESGRLFIIPNGQIKTVVNFSKGYVNAVVDIKVPTTSNLEQVMRDMTEAGRRLRTSRREVLGETVIKGLVDLTPNDMTIRAVTKVQPGTHFVMQQEYRRTLKEVFDETARVTLKALAA